MREQNKTKTETKDETEIETTENKELGRETREREEGRKR